MISHQFWDEINSVTKNVIANVILVLIHVLLLIYKVLQKDYQNDLIYFQLFIDFYKYSSYILIIHLINLRFESAIRFIFF